MADYQKVPGSAERYRTYHDDGSFTEISRRQYDNLRRAERAGEDYEPRIFSRGTSEPDIGPADTYATGWDAPEPSDYGGEDFSYVPPPDDVQYYNPEPGLVLEPTGSKSTRWGDYDTFNVTQQWASGDFVENLITIADSGQYEKIIVDITFLDPSKPGGTYTYTSRAYEADDIEGLWDDIDDAGEHYGVDNIIGVSIRGA